MSEHRYEDLFQSTFFSTNWMTNIRSSLNSREKRARGLRIVHQLIKSTKPVLNAGSNVGYHSIVASRQGHKVVSLDPSFRALKQGKQIGWIGDAICGDVMHLPFRGNAFSGAIFSEVVEEIPDQRTAISELARCSERVVITTSPIRSDVFYALVKNVKRLLGFERMDFAHLNEIHPDSLFAMLRREGLILEAVSYHNPLHIWNVFALIPILKSLDLTPIDRVLGSKQLCSGVFCVAGKTSA